MKKKIILFGTGVQGKSAYDFLNKKYDIICFADNNSIYCGKKIFDKEIICGNDIIKYMDYETDVVICSSLYYYEIGEQLNKLGITNYYVFYDGEIYKGRSAEVIVPVKVCTRCVMDNSSDKYILFKENGECNYCTNALHRLSREYFPNEEGKKKLDELICRVKEAGKGNKYDCVMGISGGLDSSYLLYKGYQWGLRILAIHIDDGFDTEISKSNLDRLVRATEVDYEVIKPDPEQFNDLSLAYMKAGVPNIAIPQDNVLLAFLYKQMKKNDIQFFLSGGNFALESILQRDNTYDNLDVSNIYEIHKQYGTKSLDKLSFVSRKQMEEDRHIYGIESPRPLNYIKYERDAALKELYDFCGFEYYGRKHLENYFTAFAQLYWLPTKFGVDKRKSHLSSMIVSNQLSRDDALEEIGQPIYDKEKMNYCIEVVKQKLGISDNDLKVLMQIPSHRHEDY